MDENAEGVEGGTLLPEKFFAEMLHSHALNKFLILPATTIR